MTLNTKVLIWIKSFNASVWTQHVRAGFHVVWAMLLTNAGLF